MTSPVDITALIPARDAEATIGNAVRSALDQDRPPKEVVVVDDGSTDGTREAVARVSDDRVRIVGGPARGVAAARNLGLDRARTSWVAFLDADDEWMPNHVGAVLDAIAASPAVKACFGSAIHLTDSDELANVLVNRPDRVTVRDLLTGRLQPTTSATAVDRRFAVAVGGFYEGFRRAAGVEDADLWTRIVARASCTAAEQPSVRYLVQESRDRLRRREDLQDLALDHEQWMERVKEEVDDPSLVRLASARDLAVVARYWLVSGFRHEARRAAWRSLATRPTNSGAGALLMASAPVAVQLRFRRLRRFALTTGRR